MWVGISRRHWLGRLQPRIPRLGPHSDGLHAGVHDHVPEGLQLPVESQTHGVHPGDHLERPDGPRQTSSLTSWLVLLASAMRKLLVYCI